MVRRRWQAGGLRRSCILCKLFFWPFVVVAACLFIAVVVVGRGAVFVVCVGGGVVGSDIVFVVPVFVVVGVVGVVGGVGVVGVDGVGGGVVGVVGGVVCWCCWCWCWW